VQDADAPNNRAANDRVPDAPNDSRRADPPEERTSAVRRYGPIAGIGVVLAVVATISVVTMGDDDDGPETEEDAVAATGDFPDGVVTPSMAQDQGLEDVEFPDTCDPESGMVAVPFWARAECVANVDDNGGATAPGVTADRIDVVAWLPDDGDSVLTLAREAYGSDATADDMRQAYEGLVEIFQGYYQTYGRTVNLEFIESSGDTLDPVAARSDATAVVEQEPFAVLGGPITANTWTFELHAHDIVCMGCPGIRNPEPTAFTVTPSQGQVSEHITNYIRAKLAGQPAEFAGGELSGQERSFGLLKLGMNPGDQEDFEFLQDLLDDAGIEIAETFTYELDIGGAQELATSFVSQFKEAGVTTVVAQADPIILPAMTEEATRQDWYPEWFLPAAPFIDTNTWARSMNQEQWANAFGISYLPPHAPPELSPAYQLYEWYHGEPPPAADLLFLIYPQVAMFFTGLSYAGPDLNPETFRDGLFAAPPTPRAISQPSVYYGTALWDPEVHGHDYDGVDDMVELWWDPNAAVGEEEPPGAYRYVDGGQRHYADEYTSELRVFDPNGAVTEITDPPPEEVPPDYPPPAGGGRRAEATR
jgi:hypothetical protein